MCAPEPWEQEEAFCSEADLPTVPVKARPASMSADLQATGLPPGACVPSVVCSIESSVR